MQITTVTSTLIELTRKTDGSQNLKDFAQDVHTGLSQMPKNLSSRYFYDAAGSRLFQRIMDLPEYYLTRAEFNVLDTHKQAMAEALDKGGFFHLIDLGAGDALKTKLLLSELQLQAKSFDYIPIDISGAAMRELSEDLQGQYPYLRVQAVVGEYIQGLDWLHTHKHEQKVVLFLGSNIGNFEREEALGFLKQIRASLNPGDRLLLGIDLRKDPGTILRAYDDAAGVTATFNLNLLHRMNRELGANFEVAQFQHFAMYDPQEGVMKSFLVSQTDQEVYIEATGQSYTFAAWEAIHTENSHKYTLDQVREMGREAGFEITNIFQDDNGSFADVLFSAC